ncbi:hypothetical protein GOP47_0022550 [Adiantum capillus-veneris]|uniref:Uncharacterized protein n=1 Tax=Adiantum capillus-veneris TaxID=13818 RepID=A0A9D4U7Y1_ADICA|nr:hypothetical protein GOP47_0022550 [Adiantum capillus-veneris]
MSETQQPYLAWLAGVGEAKLLSASSELGKETFPAAGRCCQFPPEEDSTDPPFPHNAHHSLPRFRSLTQDMSNCNPVTLSKPLLTKCVVVLSTADFMKETIECKEEPTSSPGCELGFPLLQRCLDLIHFKACQGTIFSENRQLRPMQVTTSCLYILKQWSLDSLCLQLQHHEDSHCSISFFL